MSRKSRNKKNTKGEAAQSPKSEPAPATPTEPLSKPEATEKLPAAPTTSLSTAMQPANYASAHASDSRSLKTRFSFYVLLAVIVGISLLSFRVMKGFVLPLFLAALTVVIFKPVHNWIRSKLGNRETLAAGLTTTAILLVVLGPLGWVLTIGITQGLKLNTKFSKTIDLPDINEKLDPIRAGLGVDIRFEDDMNDVEATIESLKLNSTTDHTREVAEKHQNVLVFQDEFSQLTEALLAEIDARPQLEAKLDSATDPDTRKDVANKLKWIDRIQRIERVEVLKQDDLPKPEAPSEPANFQVEADARNLMTFLENELKDGEANAAQVDDYNSLIETLEVDYQLLRQQLLGGPGWATLTELANPGEEQIESLLHRAQEMLRGLLFKVTGKTTSVMSSLMMQLFILSVAIYYFLIDGPEMVNAAMHLSPMDDRYEKEMIDEFAKLSRAVVVATLLSAIAQGILAGIGYFFCFGFEPLFILIILTTVFAMVPFVGAAAIWVPCCLYLYFVDNSLVAAIMLALYGFFIVSMADNIIKPMVLKGQSNLHPLFALLSVIGGVQALGPVGVLVGPMLVAFLQSLLKLLNRDLGAASGEY